MAYCESDLEDLIRIKNHKIIYDGYEYWWQSYKSGSWSLHCVKPFPDYKSALAYIRYWLHQYLQMLIDEEARNNRITCEVIDQVRIYDIVNSNKSTFNKVCEIYAIKPFLTQEEAGKMLGMSKMTISRTLKQLKK